MTTWPRGRGLAMAAITWFSRTEPVRARPRVRGQRRLRSSARRCASRSCSGPTRWACRAFRAVAHRACCSGVRVRARAAVGAGLGVAARPGSRVLLRLARFVDRARAGDRRRRVVLPSHAAAIDLGAEPTRRRPASLPDVFVLVLDTVRADHLSSYGYARDTTPNLTRFLSEHPEAVQYEFAFSPASWTVPAHASLLTGKMPSAHRARSGDGNCGSRPKWWRSWPGRRSPRSLRERGLLHGRGRGQRLRCFTSRGCGGASKRSSNRDPFAGFFLLGNELRKRFLPCGVRRPDQAVSIGGGDQRACAPHAPGVRPRPSFVLANYMEAHSPYLAPEPHAGSSRAIEHPRMLLEFAVLVRFRRARRSQARPLRRSPPLSSTPSSDVCSRSWRPSASCGDAWLFITSDHGEAFREHGTTSHGSSIYNEQVRIPLIVKPPRGVRGSRRRGSPSRCSIVTTTIAGDRGPRRVRGGARSAAAADSRSGGRNRVHGRLSDNVAELVGETADDPARAVVSRHWKLLERGGRYRALRPRGRSPRDSRIAARAPTRMQSARREASRSISPERRRRREVAGDRAALSGRGRSSSARSGICASDVDGAASAARGRSARLGGAQRRARRREQLVERERGGRTGAHGLDHASSRPRPGPCPG